MSASRSIPDPAPPHQHPPSPSLIRRPSRRSSTSSPPLPRPLTILVSLIGLLTIYLISSSIWSAGVRRSHRAKRTLTGYSQQRQLNLPPELADASLASLLAHPLLTSHPTPRCALHPVQEERYAPLKPGYRKSSKTRHGNRGDAKTTHDKPRHHLNYFIVANLYSSSNVLPSLISAIHAVTSSLDPKRFHVSIYENGSDDETPHQLYLFAQVLERLGVGYTIESSTKKKNFKPDERIEGLAALRNEAMRPLYESPKGTFDRVLFLNDVHVCEADLLELLLQHEVQGADMSCGMDYKLLDIPEFEDYPLELKTNFYDVWVARTMEGLPFYKIKYPTGDWELPSLPLPHSASRGLLHSLLPFQVFSCFNGVTVLDASLFYRPNSIRFRSEANSDRESECFLLCKEIWRTYSPLSSPGLPLTGYELSEYETARNDRNVTAWTGDVEGRGRGLVGLDKEMIKWQTWPPKLVASFPYGHWDEEAWVPPFDVEE
ncbi:GDP-Man:alpha-1,3-mannosyltransferase, glycosyltransferase family 69 protein [Pseudohyphozyma bogoriensis]|nr:GDP-Man:alpha-1,3-mannosyltransferase, glycosyltransferase family 69 protein [Pseudohyphozyma bogoriensis]